MEAIKNLQRNIWNIILEAHISGGGWCSMVQWGGDADSKSLDSDVHQLVSRWMKLEMIMGNGDDRKDQG